MVKTLKNSRCIVWLLSIVLSIAGIIIILVTSCELAIYGDMDYFQVLYERYDIAEDLNMEMDDILYVTDEMMQYLRGDREDLIVDTVVGGVAQEFFNETEISHMEDVQELFLAGLHLRMISIGIVVLLFIFFIILKMEWMDILAKAFRRTTLAFVVVVGTLGYLFATNFYKYFEMFHEIFFEDGTWTFDPNESLMINMLPEGLFYDFTSRIVVIFLGTMIVVLVSTCFISKRYRKKKSTSTDNK